MTDSQDTRRLTPYSIRQQINRLNLSDTTAFQVQAVLELMDGMPNAGDGLTTADVLNRLFQHENPAVANNGFRRLRNAVNKAAEDSGVNLRWVVEENKKAGSQRRTWFEEDQTKPKTVPNLTQQLSELDRMTREGIEPVEQRAWPEGLPPVVVLLTFNEYEMQAVRNEFGSSQWDSVIRNNHDYRQVKTLIHGVSVVHCHSTKQALAAAQAITCQVIEDWAPKAVLSVGICLGHPSVSKLGDVVISEAVRNFNRPRIGDLVLPRDYDYRASDALLNRVVMVDTEERDKDKLWPTIHRGLMVSGDQLVSYAAEHDKIWEIFPKAQGADTEAYGLAVSCFSAQVDWLVIKGVSDYGAEIPQNEVIIAEPKANDQAARNAAQVVGAMLRFAPLYSRGQTPSIFPVPMVNSMWRNDWNEQVLYPIGTQKGKEGTLVAYGGSNLAQNHESVRVLNDLVEWATTPDSSPYYALFGEAGMGKSVTCQLLVRHLEEQYQKDPNIPIGLYFDLRNIHNDKWSVVPTLDEILIQCMGGWNTGGSQPTMRDFWHWVESGAVVVFDGLDEALTAHPEWQRKFTQELLSLPDIASLRFDHPVDMKVLVSMRTQFYSTLLEQKSSLTGFERANQTAALFKVVTLLPFTREQIEEYLSHVLNPNECAKIMSVVKESPKFEEVLSRPYLLRLSTELKDLRSAGKDLRMVSVYEQMVNLWILQDEGRHIIDPLEKPSVMAYVAWKLWRSGKYEWTILKYQQWMREWIAIHDPERYQNIDVNLLNQDLQAVTFLSRDDMEKDDNSVFRFAHTSFLEYFVARYLRDALVADDSSGWDFRVDPPPTPEDDDQRIIRPPDHEIWTFLGQLLQENETERMTRRLQRWATGINFELNAMIVRYSSEAGEEHLPTPVLSQEALQLVPSRPPNIEGGLQLQGVEGLYGEVIVGLNLSGANFTGANLTDTLFIGNILDNANFTFTRWNSSLTGYRFSRSLFTTNGYFSSVAIATTSAKNSSWIDSRLNYMSFISVDFANSTWAGADLEHTYFVSGDVSDGTWTSSVEKAVFAQFDSPEQLRAISSAMPIRFQPSVDFLARQSPYFASVAAAADALKSRQVDVGMTLVLGPQVWRVLQFVESRCALLLSEYAVDLRPYDYQKSSTWVDSDLRNWLNDDHYGFLSTLNCDLRQALIRVPADSQETIFDKVSLLSSDQAERLLVSGFSDVFCSCQRWRSQGYNYCWWLRDPYYLVDPEPIATLLQLPSDHTEVCFHELKSGITTSSDPRACLAVRPIIWLNLE